MDLSKVSAAIAHEDKPATLLLNGPDGKSDFAADGKTRASVDIVGVYSAVYQKRAADFRATQSENPVEQTDRELQILSVAWAIVAWNGIESSGEPVPLNDQTVVQVLTAAPWVYDQARMALNNRGALFTVAPGV